MKKSVSNKLHLKIIFLYSFCLLFFYGNSFSFTIEKPVYDDPIIDLDSSNYDPDFNLQEEIDLLSNIDDFIDLPEGATPWEVFAETGMDEYTFEDNKGLEWTGVRPKFTREIRILDSKKILVQGYMFPLDQNEKQKTFLLVPFPQTCPYFPHVSSNLIIEVHTKNPILYSYEAVNIEGELELVENDDLYNIFFRLNNAKLALK